MEPNEGRISIFDYLLLNTNVIIVTNLWTFFYTNLLKIDIGYRL